MLKIWGRTSSVNVQKVMWAVEELGVPHTRVDAGREFGVVDTPEYRRLNPNALVPTIEDGGFVMWESNACVRYLYAKYGPPRTPEQNGAADKWMDWSATVFAHPMRDLFWGYVRTAPEKRDAAALEAARQKAVEQLKMIEDALVSQPYIGGAEFSMGDIPLGCFAFRWFNLPIERPELPHVKAWYDRLTARPAYRKHVMLPMQ